MSIGADVHSATKRRLRPDALDRRRYVRREGLARAERDGHDLAGTAPALVVRISRHAASARKAATQRYSRFMLQERRHVIDLVRPRDSDVLAPATARLNCYWLPARPGFAAPFRPTRHRTR